jgi:hypothetical protein
MYEDRLTGMKMQSGVRVKCFVKNLVRVREKIKGGARGLLGGLINELNYHTIILLEYAIKKANSTTKSE